MSINIMENVKVPRGKRPRVHVSLGDKERAIARIRNGETKAGISRELGVPESTVRGWVKRAEQRMAIEALQNTPMNVVSAADSNQALRALCQPFKRNANGQIVPPAAPQLSQVVQPPMPLPMQLFNRAAERKMQVYDWLQVFNAGLLNFTLVATAAYLQAQARGCLQDYTLWEIICNYVNEAGHKAARKQQQELAMGNALLPAISRPTMQVLLPKRQRVVKLQAPRHITAEDDEFF